MRLSHIVLAAAFLAAPGLAFSADDPLKGWTLDQLKTKVLQLKKENDELRAKLASGGGSSAAAAPAAKATADLLVDDFEGSTAKNGLAWWNGADDNKLGTTLSPATYAPAPGGKSGMANCIKGHLGTSKAPWPWASSTLKTSSPDLSGYSGLSFWVKGDGKRHKLTLVRTAVKDYAHYYAEFETPKAWTKVSLPFTAFAQPSQWGNKVPAAWNDVEAFQFEGGTPDDDFDYCIDDLTLVK